MEFRDGVVMDYLFMSQKKSSIRILRRRWDLREGMVFMKGASEPVKTVPKGSLALCPPCENTAC